MVSNNPPEMGPNPRELAARLIARWERSSPASRPPLSVMCSDLVERCPGGWDPRDKALAWELVFGVVRHLLFLDYRLRSCLHSRRSLDPLVRAHLLAGAYQLLFLDRVPARAAVNEAVGAVRRAGRRWAAGLVNAVLRRIAALVEERGREEARKVDEQGWRPARIISVETSHPLWMVERWISRYGIQGTRCLCEAGNLPAPLTLRVNRLRLSVEEARKFLERRGVKAAAGRYSPCALVLRGFRGDPSSVPGLEDGLFQVQDESSQLASLLLSPGSGQKVLDACAGLGGKTTHLAELSRDRARVIATDPSRGRLALLEKNARRLGLGSIEVVSTGDPGDEGGYDKVLVDAPCSGLGVIRRHPDIKWNRSPGGLEALSALQAELLDRYSRLAVPGGELVYSVCTMEPEETDLQVRSFLNRHPEWELVHAASRLPLPAAALTDREGFLRIVPRPGGPDGFFASLLRRKGSGPGPTPRRIP